MPDISVLMPCYNRSYDLPKTLKAYDRQNTTKSFELIAVDDASSDDTLKVLTSYKASRFSLRVLRQDKNQGPAAARNLGLSFVKSPVVVFVGDDIQPAPDFITAHLKAHEEYPQKEVAILGKIDPPDDMPNNTLMEHINGIGAQQFSYFYFQNAQEYDYRHLYTANISLKMEMLNTLDHWFDTDFPFAAFEDVELSYRLSKKGLRIVYLSSPIAKHYHYHTALSFSERQYRAGMMANLLSQKHPGIAWFFKGQYRKVLSITLKAFVKHYPKECFNRIESRALRLASQHEWVHHPNLDNFYLGFLEYYYYKGMIDGLFGENFPSACKQRIHNSHAFLNLFPLLRLLERKSDRLNENLNSVT